MRHTPLSLFLLMTLPGCSGSENAQLAAVKAERDAAKAALVKAQTENADLLTAKNDLKAAKDERDAIKTSLAKVQESVEGLQKKLKDAETKLTAAQEKLAALGVPKKTDPPAGDQPTAGTIIVYRSGVPERLHVVEQEKLSDLAAFFKKQAGGGGDPDKRLDAKHIGERPRYVVLLTTTENNLLRIVVSKDESQPWWAHETGHNLANGHGGRMKGDFDKFVAGLGKGQNLDDRSEPTHALVCVLDSRESFEVRGDKLKELLSHSPGWEQRKGGLGGGGAGGPRMQVIVFFQRNADPVAISIEAQTWYAGTEPPTKHNTWTNDAFDKFVHSLRKSKGKAN